MIVPEGKTEEEVLAIINKISQSLAGKFKFGYHTYDDMKQYATMFAIDGTNHYDESKGDLENFLRIHVRNRLFNLKRDNYQRPDKPCLNCPLNAYDPNYSKSYSGCTAYSDKSECAAYKAWFDRNEKKKNVLSPIAMENVQDENESSMHRMNDLAEEIDMRDMIQLIEDRISLEYRENWIRLKNGAKIPKSKKEKLIAHIHEILEAEGIDVAQAW